MAKTFQVDIITPTEIISEDQVEYLRAPSVEGLFGVQAGHSISTILLDIGEIKITKEVKEFYYAINGGFADIRPENVMLLLETVEKISEIDEERAEVALERAKKRLVNKDVNIDLDRAQHSIKKAQNSLNVIKHLNR